MTLRLPAAGGRVERWPPAGDETTIAKALVGTWRVEHLFTLKQARELYQTMQRLIAECDAAQGGQS